MAKETQGQGVRGLSGVIIFTLIAALLWLIIKLSDTYTVTVPFAIQYIDAPASQIIQDKEQSVNVTITTTGFKLLNYYFQPKKNRMIVISLKEIKYKRYDGNIYSYSSKYIIDNIGEYLALNATDITTNEDILYFNMSRQTSKKVRIVPVTNFTFEKQYNYYGEPTANPDSIVIYGSVEDLRDIKEVKTEAITMKNVKQNIEMTVPIDLNEHLSTDTKEVELSVNVEKFTEAEVSIPIEIPEGLNIQLDHNEAKVRYIVAMKDYSIINKLSFKAIADTNDMYSKDDLPVKLVLSPSNTQIIGINPKTVGYIILQQ